MSTIKYALPESIHRFTLLNPASWKEDAFEDRECLVLMVPGPQLPPVRRPGEYALLNSDGPLRDYSLVVEGQSIEPLSLVGRDVCVLFGYQDDTHFYYAHISNDSNNETHNVLMKIEGGRRQPIHEQPYPEPRMREGWHRIKLEHRSSGKITVWVDDMETPLMTAYDTDYRAGRVGFGAFDDRAAFSSITIVSHRDAEDSE